MKNAKSEKPSEKGSEKGKGGQSKSTPTYRRESSVPSKAASQVTTDHDKIRQWAEERNASPACVRGTGGKGDIGMLRLDFPGFSGEGSLEHISWDEWFDKFEERKLALLFQEETSKGEKSNFNKILSRETAEEATKPKARKAGGK